MEKHFTEETYGRDINYGEINYDIMVKLIMMLIMVKLIKMLIMILWWN